MHWCEKQCAKSGLESAQLPFNRLRKGRQETQPDTLKSDHRWRIRRPDGILARYGVYPEIEYFLTFAFAEEWGGVIYTEFPRTVAHRFCYYWDDLRLTRWLCRRSNSWLALRLVRQRVISGASSKIVEIASDHYHHLTGQTSLLLAPRATRLCQAKAKSVSNSAPTPTGANRKVQDILFDTTTSGSMPAGG